MTSHGRGLARRRALAPKELPAVPDQVRDDVYVQGFKNREIRLCDLSMEL
jgi:hypothetical protein